MIRRHPNYIWDQLADDRLAAGLIVDGIHIGAAFLKVALRAKGVARTVLVTDASMPALATPGPYKLGEVEVELTKDGRVVLRGGDRLAGSGLRMDDAVSNVLRMAGVSLTEALSMATRNPARVGRIAGRQRGIATGDRADFVIFRWHASEKRIEPVETIMGGKLSGAPRSSYTLLMSGVLTNTFFDMIEQQLLDLLNRVSAVLQSAGIPHRVVGGLAVYLHVSHAEQDAGRLTKDVDIAIRRADLERIAAVAAEHGFQYRHAAGVDMLLDRTEPRFPAGGALRLCLREGAARVRGTCAGPRQGPVVLGGAWLMPVEELLRMKLTSFRLKDRVHVKDMDEVHLITPEMEASLHPLLRERLAHIRATE